MPNYDIDKEAVKAGIDVDKEAELAKSAGVYDEMESSVKDAYDKQEAAIDNAQKEQTKVQNAMTDFAIDEIEQNKEYAKKDYLKEQSGAYKDWQKQSNAYGVNAEQQAAQGLKNTGFSESSQVAMYNQYQNRVATARESFVRAVQDYDNDMTQARLQNSSILAEIAVNALKEKAALAVQEVAQLQQIWGAKESARQTIEQNYYQRYLAELEQINKENQLAESVRQHEAQMAHAAAQLAEQRRQFDILHSGGGDIKDDDETPKTEEIDKPKDDGGDEIKKGDEVKKEDYPVDTNSLVACGLAGASAETIEKEIAAGKLIERVKNGKLTYTRPSSPLLYNAPKIQSEEKTVFDKIGDKFKEWFS